MNKAKMTTIALAGVLLAATTAMLPATGYARDGYRSDDTVSVGYRDHGGYGDRHRPSHHYRGHAPHGRSYGYYAPRCPTPYYRPYYRSYYAPRYYDYGHSGWDIDLRYHFSGH